MSGSGPASRGTANLANPPRRAGAAHYVRVPVIQLSERTIMKCPVDNETLVMTERSGVEIDYCPVCRGVWLDRGELDKIIERSQPQMAQPVRPAPPVQGPRVRCFA